MSMSSENCCGLNFIKAVLHVFQVVFILTGLLICGLGIWTYLNIYHYLNILDSSTYSTIVYVFLATGCLVILAAILGCCAIPKHRTKLLFCYILLLVFIFLTEALIGVLSYIYQENVNDTMKYNFNYTLTNDYKRTDSKTASIDYLQEKLKCCGANNFQDWRESQWVHIQNKTVANKVPDSCCKTITYECGRRDHPSNIFYEGCLNSVSQEIRWSLWLLCAVSLGLSVVQVFGVAFGIRLFLLLESGEYESNYSPHGNEKLLKDDDRY